MQDERPPADDFILLTDYLRVDGYDGGAAQQ